MNSLFRIFGQRRLAAASATPRRHWSTKHQGAIQHQQQTQQLHLVRSCIVAAVMGRTRSEAAIATKTTWRTLITDALRTGTTMYCNGPRQLGGVPWLWRPFLGTCTGWTSMPHTNKNNGCLLANYCRRWKHTLKTNKSIAKRFRVRGDGSLKRLHILFAWWCQLPVPLPHRIDRAP
jgi:hypothetical protein